MTIRPDYGLSFDDVLLVPRRSSILSRKDVSTVVDTLYQLVGGLRSGLSYAGARTIEELWQAAEFIRISPFALQESGPHNVELI
jgi:IMP dehydrogenase/GMP reductase